GLGVARWGGRGGGGGVVGWACWARNPALIPVSTSPIPALAIPGLPDVLICHTPSGAAQMLPVPLSTTRLLNVPASFSAAATRSSCTSRVEIPRSRAASAGGGGSTGGPRRPLSLGAAWGSAATRVSRAAADSD